MNHQKIKTLGELKKSGYVPRSVKEEIRNNLISKLQQGESTFEGIMGYEDTVIPDVERALLSKHNILFLGLRGQAKTRMARQMTSLLDEYIPVLAGSERNDDPWPPTSRVARGLVAGKGGPAPIAWRRRGGRYGDNLAPQEASVAELLGDIRGGV